MRQSFVIPRPSTLVLRLPLISVSLATFSSSGRVRLKTILLLEDNDERIAGFKSAVHELGEDWQVRIWHDAPTMIAECEDCRSWSPASAPSEVWESEPSLILCISPDREAGF
jgi:hypothetical protein